MGTVSDPAASRPARPSPGRADLVIAGNGPVGLVLALALQQAGVRPVMAGNDDMPAERPIALAHGTCLLLDRLGVLRDVPATPIRTIHVSDRGRLGRTLIEASDYDLPELGRVVSYAALVQALRARLGAGTRRGRLLAWQEQADAVALSFDGAQTSRAGLLVIADGQPPADPAAGAPDAGRADGGHQVRSRIRDGIHDRIRDYGQHAVVAHVRTAVAHANTAYERFTADGPLALLPDRDGFALIWSTRPEEAASLCEAAEPDFLGRLQEAFGTRLGRFLEAGPRHSFPLALRFATGRSGHRVVAIGNAAQALHPVAGQGLNLGIRDAWELAELVAASAPDAIGSPAFARAFAQRRALDRRGGIGITDALARMFSSRDPLLSPLRAAGLVALDLLPPARRFLARRMMHGARGFP